MKWTFRAARIAGIDVRIHLAFALVLLLGAVQWGSHHGTRGALFGAALSALLFGCVVLHELGHGLAARRFGLGVREIVLLPIGGVALIDGKPRRPAHELVIALAGPAVNVVIAGLLLAIVSPWHGIETVMEVAQAGRSALAPSIHTAALWLIGANVGLAIFNMIPAFPLDGGRVLRALLAMAWPARATALATLVGQGIAVTLGVYAILGGHFVLVLIAVFIYFGAAEERATEQAGALLAGVPAGLAYNRTAIALGPSERVTHAVEHVLTSYQSDFAVLHEGRLLGVVTRDEIVNALARDEGDAYLAGVMNRDVARVEAGMYLDEVCRVMAERGTRIVAVEEGGSYLGLVSREDIGEALLYLHLLQRRGRGASGGERVGDMA
jgi:Zn-dependent protease